MRSYQIQVFIDNCRPENLKGLLGAHVEVEGCVTVRNDQDDDRLFGYQVFSPSLSSLTIYRDGPATPYSVPRISLDSLGLEYRQYRDPRLIRIRGSIKEIRSPREIIVDDEKFAVRVRLSEATQLPIDSEIDVAGIVWAGHDKEFFVDRGIVRAAVNEESEPVDLPVLRNAQALHGLDREMASRAYPIEIEGVVIYYDRVWRNLFLHDGIRGFYVEHKTRSFPLEVGDRVIVKGVSDPGGFAPMVLASSVKKIGRGAVPNERKASYGRLLSGAEDSQWTSIEGVIESIDVSQKNIVIHAQNREGPFEAVLCQGRDQLNDYQWVGSKVRLVGVCGVKSNSDHQPTGIYFHVPGIEYMTMLQESSADPFSIATTSIAALMRFRQVSDENTPVKIAGTVTYVDNSGLAAIQDDSRGVFVRFKAKKTPEVGHSVEIVGIPVAQRLAPTISITHWRSNDVSGLPDAPVIAVDQIVDQGHHGRLIRTEAIVLRNNSDSIAPSLILRDGEIIFSVDLAEVDAEGKWASLQEGAKVQVQGVVDANRMQWQSNNSFRLVSNLASEISIVEQRPFWTSQHTMALVAGLSIVLLIMLSWSVTLRSTVKKQTSRVENALVARDELLMRYNTLIENAGELIFSIRPDGRFVTTNPATERVFHATQDQLLEQSIFDYLSVDDARAFASLVSGLKVENPHGASEVTTCRGTILELASRLGVDANGIVEIHCIARDVSERRVLEEQIRHMQKMESIGELAAGVAHDYNNLLTVVRVNSEMLLEFGELDDDNNKFVSLIHGAADSAASLTQQLLTFSRRQMMTTQEICLEKLISVNADMLKTLLPSNIEFEFVADGELPEIHADQAMVEQSLMNLVINARDAIGDDEGKITIRTRAVEIAIEEAARHVEALPGTFVEIAVEDSGCGIDRTTLQHIFEPFYTTKDVGKGTGLGLSTVFGVVKQHDGWIDVESTPDSGSTFKIYLPISNDEVIDNAKVDAAANIDRNNAQKVLVVEDDPSVRLTISKVLSRAGYEVIQSVNGPEALTIWENAQDSIDLVVTDMVMPGQMSGIDLAKEIRKSSPEIPVVYCSGYSSELLNDLPIGEFDRIIPKPFESAFFIRAVFELLEPGSRGSAEISSDDETQSIPA